MQGQEIFGPFFGMMLLTLVVWIVLYVRRIGYLKSHRVHAQKVATPEKVSEIIPDEVQYPAHNFKNLFEMPVLFYFLCLYLFASGNVDSWYVMGAWTFVGLRAIHSIVDEVDRRVDGARRDPLAGVPVLEAEVDEVFQTRHSVVPTGHGRQDHGARLAGRLHVSQLTQR